MLVMAHEMPVKRYGSLLSKGRVSRRFTHASSSFALNGTARTLKMKTWMADHYFEASRLSAESLNQTVAFEATCPLEEIVVRVEKYSFKTLRDDESLQSKVEECLNRSDPTV
jgi:hypothetical protein